MGKAKQGIGNSTTIMDKAMQLKDYNKDYNNKEKVQFVYHTKVFLGSSFYWQPNNYSWLTPSTS